MHPTPRNGEKVASLNDYEWFCPQPFINLTKSIFGLVKPCCVVPHEAGWPAVKISEYFESEKLRGLRSEMTGAPGEEVKKSCKVCIEQEKHSSESHRQTYLRYVDTMGITSQLEEYLDTDMEQPFIKTMEWLAPSNYCNLRCNMCGSGNSSALANENKKIGFPNYALLNGATLYDNDKVAEQDIRELADSILDGLLELKLTGGETLAIKYNYDMLDTVVNSGSSEEIDLRITTNGTLTPTFDGKDIFDYIPMFKSVLINVSIEAWGERNSYIRYPSKWETIIENVRRFDEADCDVQFVSTVGSLNIGYLWEIAKKSDYGFITGSLIWGGYEKYTVAAIPLDIREQYIQNYYDNPDSRYTEDYQKLISFLEDIPFNEEVFKCMMWDVKRRDAHRGTCLTDLYPEWADYYKRDYIAQYKP